MDVLSAIKMVWNILPRLRWIRSYWLHIDKHRRNGLEALVVMILFVTAVYLTTASLGPVYLENQQGEKVRQLFAIKGWITYDPTTGYDPISNPKNPQFPTENSIESDLEKIRQAGFAGVVTFGSRNTLGEIPRLAHDHKLSVIMGISDPRDGRELDAAVRQRNYVLGYCVGHNYLAEPQHQPEDLENAIKWLRERTWLPVTTSEYYTRYENFEKIQSIGDWLFPDVRPYIFQVGKENQTADVDRDVRNFASAVEKMVALADMEKRRSLMLKMVTYPNYGVEKASPEAQQQFYMQALQFCIEEGRYGMPFPIVFHSAFDHPWKKGPIFREWDRHVGILDPSGKPRPAAEAIVDIWLK